MDAPAVDVSIVRGLKRRHRRQPAVLPVSDGLQLRKGRLEFGGL